MSVLVLKVDYFTTRLDCSAFVGFELVKGITFDGNVSDLAFPSNGMIVFLVISRGTL